MTKAEFKKLLANMAEYDWVKNKVIIFSLPLISFNKTYNGIGAFYDFLNDQCEGWNAFTENLPQELITSKDYFIQLKAQIEALINSQNQSNSDQLESYWQNHIQNLISGSRNIFTYDCTESQFLIDIFNKEPNYYQGSYSYIIGELRSINSDKNFFIGASIANDFFKKEAQHKFSRKDSEQKSFEKLKNDIQERIDESSSMVSDHLKNANDDYKKYVEKLEELKTEKDLSFQKWFDTSKETFENFDKTSNSKIKELEKLYREQLTLEAPAAYWEQRAIHLKSEGQKWLTGLIITVVIGVCFLFYLLNAIGLGDYETLFSNTGASIKWSIIFITFISFLAFLIKTFTKLTFSTYHLVRDAEERKQLSYVYLALKENSAVTDIDRQIILQSLFSRADTGLLREDSAPTMPSSIIEKVTNAAK